MLLCRSDLPKAVREDANFLTVPRLFQGLVFSIGMISYLYSFEVMIFKIKIC